MSPELERILQALYEKRTCPPEEKPNRDATFERLIRDALTRRPRTTRDELLNALQDRYAEFRRARRKPPTIPAVGIRKPSRVEIRHASLGRR